MANGALSVATNDIHQASQIGSENGNQRKPTVVTVNKTSSIWCGIQNIGSGYIKTPFTCKFTASGGGITINSLTLSPSYFTGAGYATGFDFYDNWYEMIGTSGFSIHVRGQFTYVYEGVTIISDLYTWKETISNISTY